MMTSPSATASSSPHRVVLGAIITVIGLCYLYRRQEEHLRLRSYLASGDADTSFSVQQDEVRLDEGESPQAQLEGGEERESTGEQGAPQSWLDAGVEHFDLNETSATLDFRGTAKGPLAFALRTELFSLDRDETPTEMPSEFQRPYEYPPGCHSDGHFPRREQAPMFEPPDEMLQSFFEGFALGQAFVKTFQSLKIAQPSSHFQVQDFKTQDLLSFETSDNIKLHYPHKPICIFATGECGDSLKMKTNVGNSEDLLSVRRGAQIDNHDTVIRFGSILKVAPKRTADGVRPAERVVKPSDRGVKPSDRGVKPGEDKFVGRNGNLYPKGRLHKTFVGIATPPTGLDDVEIQPVVGNKTDVLVLQDRFTTFETLRNTQIFRSTNTTAKHIVLDGGVGHHIHSHLRERALYYKFKAGSIIASIFRTAKITRPNSREKIGPISNLMEFVFSLFLAEICTQIDVFGFDIRDESLAFWHINHIEGVKLGRVHDYALDEDPGMHRLTKAGLVALHQIMRTQSGLCLFA